MGAEQTYGLCVDISPEPGNHPVNLKQAEWVIAKDPAPHCEMTPGRGHVAAVSLTGAATPSTSAVLYINQPEQS